MVGGTLVALVAGKNAPGFMHNDPLAGTALASAVAFGGGLIVYGALKAFVGIRLDAEDECNSTDLTIHKISASAKRERLW